MLGLITGYRSTFNLKKVTSRSRYVHIMIVSFIGRRTPRANAIEEINIESNKICTHATLLLASLVCYFPLSSYLIFGMMKTAFSPRYCTYDNLQKSLKVDLNVEVLQDLIRRTIKLVQIKYFLTLLKFLTYFISMF